LQLICCKQTLNQEQMNMPLSEVKLKAQAIILLSYTFMCECMCLTGDVWYNGWEGDSNERWWYNDSPGHHS